MKNRIAIYHPNRQHAHQTALALQQKNMLAGFWVGLPCIKKHARLVPKRYHRYLVKHSTYQLQNELVHLMPVAPIIRKVADAVLPTRNARHFEYLGYRLFDYLSSKMLINSHATAVIAYENSALLTFKAARQLGIKTILDAASLHHKWQDKSHDYPESEILHQRVIRRKNEEISLADTIITCSELARDSYIDAGVAPDVVHSVMLGADIDLFTPGDIGKLQSEKFVFIFTGVLSYRKGIDIILAAFKRLHILYPEISLIFTGGAGDAVQLVKSERSPAISWTGLISQADLAHEYRRANCFVLPSRADSYGMAVAESLACGTPVIISNMVGAKDIIIHGENGFVVPVNDVDALVEKMKWCVEHKDKLLSMRANARKSALLVRWEAYYERLLELLQNVLS